MIAGLHVTNATSGVGVVFVYQASSGTVLRARTLTAGFPKRLAISDDGTRILCGANLLAASTLQLLGTMNTANSTYPITPTSTTSNFTTQANQGGAVFAPAGGTLYTVYNVNPVNSTATTNVGQLMFADPDNLLVTMGIQMPEFFAGKNGDRRGRRQRLCALRFRVRGAPAFDHFASPRWRSRRPTFCC